MKTPYPPGPQTVLIITPFFSPNVGGVETRFDCIVDYLDRHGLRTWVRTYQPVVTRGVKGAAHERRGKQIEIWRWNWPGGDLFHKLLEHPLLCAAYLCPGLFVSSFLLLLRRSGEISVIHAAGFNAALIARLLFPIFRIPYVVSVHALYEFEKGSMGQRWARWILSKAKCVLAMSPRSRADMLSIGLDDAQVSIHTNWIDVEKFAPMDRMRCKTALGLEGRFVIMMIGRLKRIKGVELLLEMARMLPSKDMCIVIAGDGDMSEAVVAAARDNEQLIFLGQIPNVELPATYNAADISIVPSIYDEGFSRVVLESLCCGIPLVASNLGLIPEEVDDTCSVLVDPSVENFLSVINELYDAPERLKAMAQSARDFGAARYSEKNMSTILDAYGMPLEQEDVN